MRLSDLRDKRIKTLDGKRLGRVHEVHCEKGQITALMCGPGSLIERLTAKEEGRRIPWECVKRVEAHAVIVIPDPPQRKAKAKPSGSRSPRRTPPSSGRRSKR
jgi:sporulation protein YlmC with PRC-barrel domain